MSKDIKVGPDGTGSYRYSIDGVLSKEPYHNAASARGASRCVQVIVWTEDGYRLRPVDSE